MTAYVHSNRLPIVYKVAILFINIKAALLLNSNLVPSSNQSRRNHFPSLIF